MKIYPYQIRQLKNTNPFESGTSSLYEEAAKAYDEKDALKDKDQPPTPSLPKVDPPLPGADPAPKKPDNLDLDNLNGKPGNVLDIIDPNAPTNKQIANKDGIRNLNSLDDLDKEIDLNSNGDDTDEKKEQLRNKARLDKFGEIEPILEQDPALQAYIEFKKTGQGTFQEFLTNIAGTNISAYDDEQLFEYAAREIEGLEDADEIAQYVYDAMNQPEKFKARDKEIIKATHKQVREEQLAKYKIDLRSQQEKLKAQQAKAHQDLQELCKKTQGNAFYGMVITPEVNEAISEKIKKDFAYYNPSNGYEIKKSWELYFWQLYSKEVIRLNASQHLNEGRDEVLNRVVRPSDNSNPLNTSLAPGQRDDEQDKRDMDAYLASKNPQNSF